MSDIQRFLKEKKREAVLKARKERGLDEREPLITFTDREYAIFADKAYKPIPEKTPHRGFIFSAEDSSLITSVFKNDKTNQIVISYRGTKDINDFIQDIVIITINPLSRTIITQKVLSGAVNDYNKIKSKYPNYQILLTGHSLGALKALVVSSRNPFLKGVVFNPFIINKVEIRDIVRKSNLKIVRNQYDLASTSLNQFTKKNIVNVKSKNNMFSHLKNHTLDQFLR